MIEIAFLPKTGFVRLLEMEPGHLPKCIGELSRVCLLRHSLDQHVEMIGHEAVGNNLHAPTRCSTQKLRDGLLASHEVREVVPPPNCAHRDEDTVSAGVAAVIKTRRMSMRHTP